MLDDGLATPQPFGVHLTRHVVADALQKLDVGGPVAARVATVGPVALLGAATRRARQEVLADKRARTRRALGQDVAQQVVAQADHEPLLLLLQLEGPGRVRCGAEVGRRAGDDARDGNRLLRGHDDQGRHVLHSGHRFRGCRIRPAGVGLRRGGGNLRLHVVPGSQPRAGGRHKALESVEGLGREEHLGLATASRSEAAVEAVAKRCVPDVDPALAGGVAKQPHKSGGLKEQLGVVAESVEEHGPVETGGGHGCNGVNRVQSGGGTWH